jgi:hypothetical protein
MNAGLGCATNTTCQYEQLESSCTSHRSHLDQLGEEVSLRFIIVRPLLLLCAILFLPAFVFAQEAVLTGIITDKTSAVLPGVTVQVTHERSRNTFETVTAASCTVRCEIVPAIYAWHLLPMPTAARPCSNCRISRSLWTGRLAADSCRTSTTTRRRAAAI